LLGFKDGSYVELISSVNLNPPETAFWSNLIVENSGHVLGLFELMMLLELNG